MWLTRGKLKRSDSGGRSEWMGGGVNFTALGLEGRKEGGAALWWLHGIYIRHAVAEGMARRGQNVQRM